MKTRFLTLLLLLAAAAPAAARSKSVDAAQRLYDAGKFPPALKAFELIARREPGTKDGAYAAMMVGLCDESLGDLPGARKALVAYLRASPDDGGAGEYYLGEVLSKQGDQKAARRAFGRALAAPKTSPWVRRLAYERLGRTPRLAELAQGLADIGENDLALEAFPRVDGGAAGTKDGAYARLMIALLYERLKKDDLAEKAFADYAARGKPSGAGWYYYGAFMMRRGKASRARAFFADAVAAPDCPAWARKKARAALASKP